MTDAQADEAIAVLKSIAASLSMLVQALPSDEITAQRYAVDDSTRFGDALRTMDNAPDQGV